MTPSPSSPFLGPALREIERGLGPVEGRIEAVCGSDGRVFRVRSRDADVILRIARATSSRDDRRREMANHATAARAGLAPRLRLADPDGRWIVVDRVVGGRCLAASRGPMPNARLSAVAERLAHLHAGAPFEGRLDVRSAVARYVGTGRVGRGLRLPPSVRGAFDRLSPRLDVSVTDPVPLHGDPHPGNWIETPDALWLVDFEFAAMGPREWDVAEFAGSAELDAIDSRRFLDAYEGAAGCRVSGSRFDRCRVAVDALAAAWSFREASETGIRAWRRHGARRLRRACRRAGNFAHSPGFLRGCDWRQR